MDTVKKLLSNPKTKSLTLLGLYFLIGFIIIGIFRPSTPLSNTLTNEDSVKEDTSVLVRFNTMDNYEYKITYNDEVLEGKVLKDKILIKYKGKIYNDLKQDINPLLLMSNKELYSLIKTSTLKLTGKDVIDNLNFNSYIGTIDKNDITITEYENDNNVVKVVLTLSKQDVVYEYFNFNNVEDWG